MTIKLGVLATAGKASENDSTGAVMFMVGGFLSSLSQHGSQITSSTAGRKTETNKYNSKCFTGYYLSAAQTLRFRVSLDSCSPQRTFRGAFFFRSLDSVRTKLHVAQYLAFWPFGFHHQSSSSLRSTLHSQFHQPWKYLDGHRRRAGLIHIGIGQVL